MAHYIVSDNIPMPGKDQDYVLTDYSSERNYAVAAIADGVSNSDFAETGANIAVTELMKVLVNESGLSGYQLIDYSCAYADVSKALSSLADQTTYVSAGSETKSAYATTLITACIGDSLAQFSFVGNGGIIEIRKEWFELDEQNMFRFGISSYLNPHIRLRDSETPLFKVLKGTNQVSSIKPDVITIQSESVNSSSYLICTDGLYSFEESSVFYDSDTGEYFRQPNPKLVSFFRLLKQKQELVTENPEEFKRAFRDVINNGNLLDDDLSYALFIP